MRFTLLTCLLLFSSLGFSQSKAQRKLEDIERRRFAAMVAKDTAALQTMLADDLTYLHSNGLLEDKAQHISNIGTGKLVYSSMEPTEMKVRVRGRAAIINGIVQVAGTLNGKPYSVRLRYTNVYTKAKGKWRLAAWQSLRMDS